MRRVKLPHARNFQLLEAFPGFTLTAMALLSDPTTAPKISMGDRLKYALLKPEIEDSEPAEPMSVDDLEDAVRYANDKERLVGLLAAPIAGFLALVVTSQRIFYTLHLADGRVNPHPGSISIYYELGATLGTLALAMLALGWFRKRLYLGITMALYGLAIFNLGFWGFGLPFLLFGSWLLVRAYRLQRGLKEAVAD
jgi:hypothetical protein